MKEAHFKAHPDFKWCNKDRKKSGSTSRSRRTSESSVGSADSSVSKHPSIQTHQLRASTPTTHVNSQNISTISTTPSSPTSPGSSTQALPPLLSPSHIQNPLQFPLSSPCSSPLIQASMSNLNPVITKLTTSPFAIPPNAAIASAPESSVISGLKAPNFTQHQFRRPIADSVGSRSRTPSLEMDLKCREKVGSPFIYIYICTFCSIHVFFQATLQTKVSFKVVTINRLNVAIMLYSNTR